MELLFSGKEAKSHILQRVKSHSPSVIDNNKSYVIQGDNFDVMAGILQHKKGFVDLVYIDPPFNTNQTFSVSENRANTISRSKTKMVAYSDDMNDEDFIKFMYERLILIHELLSDEGSLYLHIDSKKSHCLKLLLDEIFGAENFKNEITRIKCNPKNFDRKAYGNEKDVILFYSKNHLNNIWNEIKIPLSEEELMKNFPKIDSNGRRYTTIPLHAPGETANGPTGMPWRGMMPPEGRHWRTAPDEFEKMDALGLIEWSKTGNPRIKKFADQHKGKKIQDVWRYKDPQYPIYPTQKNAEMLEQIILQSSKEDSIVMDCFAGSGTTLAAAAKCGRKFIGIDSSDTAINIIKSRLNNVEFVSI